MISFTTRPRLLLKLAGVPPAQAAFGLGVASPFQFERLFPGDERELGLSAAAIPQWYIANAQEDGEPANAWEMCHRL
jgi:hypothetical protein